MKYAFFILSFMTLSTFANTASARSINSFRESDSITTVAQFLEDVSADVPVAARLSDKKTVIKDFSKCTDVSADEVMKAVETSIKRVLRFYPDEDVPFYEAINDLEDYLDHRTYKRCEFQNKSIHSSTTYFTDLSDKIHLRLDNVALTAE